MHLCYLGLGSNLGDGASNLDEAIRLLRQQAGEVVAVAPYLQSEPWGFKSQHIFTNGACALRTTLTPLELLDVTQGIERQMGRTHKRQSATEAYTDRIIDIDLLCFDDLTLHTDRLTLPHPLMFERDFVRIPYLACLAMVNNG